MRQSIWSSVVTRSPIPIMEYPGHSQERMRKSDIRQGESTEARTSFSFAPADRIAMSAKDVSPLPA
jgi:hypothetical protein